MPRCSSIRYDPEAIADGDRARAVGSGPSRRPARQGPGPRQDFSWEQSVRADADIYREVAKARRPTPAPGAHRLAKKVALVHDWLTGMRGGEKALEVLCELYPDADLFTLIHRPGLDVSRHRAHASANVVAATPAGDPPVLPACASRSFPSSSSSST